MAETWIDAPAERIFGDLHDAMNGVARSQINPHTILMPPGLYAYMRAMYKFGRVNRSNRHKFRRAVWLMEWEVAREQAATP